MFTDIRNWLNAGRTAEQICTTMGACLASESAERQKFVSMRQQHARFQKGFNAIF